MHLKCDFSHMIFVWVDDDNEDIELSPHFDYEEDAIQWYGRVTHQIFDEFGIVGKADE